MSLDDQIDPATVRQLESVIHSAVADAMHNIAQQHLTDDEISWVRIAIQAEARRIRFRDAVIEKSVVALAWAALVFVGLALFEYGRSLILGAR